MHSLNNNQKTKTFYRQAAVAGLALLYSSNSVANPSGANFVSGKVEISNPNNNHTVIKQHTDKAIINWQEFNIKENEHTQFVQPSKNSITLNRVVGHDPSAILGQLTANGKILLINPNGVLFGKNSQVDVAALIASTHDIKDEDFLSGKLSFTIPGNPGAQIINQGKISVEEGGLVALVAPSVTNTGLIQARLGKVTLASANTFTLDLYGDDLIVFEADGQITEQIKDAFGNPLKTAIENSGKIEADGGHVLLTTDIAKNVVDKAINMSGIIKAQTAEEHEGSIILHAHEAHTDVSGILDASAPKHGNGGFIETSGAEVTIQESTQIDTSSKQGETGEWLLDPTDYYIEDSGGDISGEQIASFLNHNNVTIQTADEGGDRGDIFVNDEITWSNTNKLTLTAHRDINVNKQITNTANGTLKLRSDNQGSGTGTVNFGTNGSVSSAGTVDLFYNPTSYTSPTNYASKISASNLTSYMLVNDVYQLQNITSNLSGNYALGKDINASATRSWNGGKGFQPIGLLDGEFNGEFNGLGNKVESLYFNISNIDEAAGIFGIIGELGRVHDVNVHNIKVATSGMQHAAGGLAAINLGAIENVTVSGHLENIGTHPMTSNFLGGVIGLNIGRIFNAVNYATIKGNGTEGGIVGATTSSPSIQLNGISQVSNFGRIIGGNGYTGGVAGLVTNGTVNLASNYGAISSLGGTAGSLFGDAVPGSVIVDAINYSVEASTSNGIVASLIGRCVDCTISNAINISDVDIPIIGSVVHNMNSSNIFWNAGSSSRHLEPSQLAYEQQYDVKGLADFQMKQQASYSGFDFVNTWRIDEGVSYPTLAWQEDSSSPDTWVQLTANQIQSLGGANNNYYFENANGTKMFSMPSFSGSHLPEVTIQITNGFQSGEDVLEFTNSGNVSGAYNQSTGILSLSGNATVEDYQAVLDSVKYKNLSDAPSTSIRTIEVSVGKSNTSKTIAVVPVNDAPILNPNVYGGNANGIKTPELNIDNNDGILISSLVGNNLISDIDDDFRGIAVKNLDNTKWQFTTDGITWQDFPQVSDSKAVLLAANETTRIRQIPNNLQPGETSDKAFAFFAWDGQTGTNGQTSVDVNNRGGETAYSQDWGRAITTVFKTDKTDAEKQHENIIGKTNPLPKFNEIGFENSDKSGKNNDFDGKGSTLPEPNTLDLDNLPDPILVFNSDEVNAAKSGLELIAGETTIVKYGGKAIDAIQFIELIFESPNEIPEETLNMAAAKMLPFLGTLTAYADLGIYLSNKLDSTLKQNANADVIGLLLSNESSGDIPTFTNTDVLENKTDMGMLQRNNVYNSLSAMSENGLLISQKVGATTTYQLTPLGAFAIYFSKVKDESKDDNFGLFGMTKEEKANYNRSLRRKLGQALYGGTDSAIDISEYGATLLENSKTF